MAHYAILNDQNIVIEVFVGRDDEHVPDGYDSWEIYYAPPGLTCKQTSYNTHGGINTHGGKPLRKNYAGIGYTYDPTRDAFIAPQPFPSWILDETSCVWHAPVPKPDGWYDWDETTQTWIPVTE